MWLTGTPWWIIRSTRPWSDPIEQELSEQRGLFEEPIVLRPAVLIGWYEALPLSSDAVLCLDPDPALPLDDPGLSRPGDCKKILLSTVQKIESSKHLPVSYQYPDLPVNSVDGGIILQSCVSRELEVAREM